MLHDAAKNRSAPRPPGGRRVSEVEVAARLDEADRRLRAGESRAAVVAALCGAFGMSERAADSYISRARRRWETESKDRREVERDVTVARLASLSAKAEERGAFAAAVSAEKLSAQIRGLLAPVEVKTTLAETAPEPDLTVEEAIAELEGLNEVIRQARRRTESGDGDAALLDG